MIQRLRSIETLGRVARPLLRGLRAARGPFLRRRAFHAYCAGMAKSGTHSIAGIFGGHRAAHEPEAAELIDRVLAVAAGRGDDADLRRYVRQADRRLRLEMSSSQLNYFVIDHLVEEFPRARFILTVREPRSWLESMINQQLGRPCPERWRRLRDLRLGAPGGHPEAEQPLAELGLYTLEGYLSYWAAHNRGIVRRVPRDRLLVVDTREIEAAIPRMAEFVGVPAATLDAGAAHAFKTKKRYDVLKRMDRGYIERMLDEHCGALRAGAVAIQDLPGPSSPERGANPPWQGV